MAIVFDGPVAPDALTTFVRNVPLPSVFTLNNVLPDRYFDKNTLDVAELTRTNRTARFRTFDARLHVSDRDVYATKQVKLPPLSSSLSMGEYERLQLEFARTGGTNSFALIQSIYNDAQNLTREIQARMELARGDVLADGVFTMMGATKDEPEGLVADYGVPAGNLVAPAVQWTVANKATATPLDNLIAWHDAYVALNGVPPGRMIVSLATSRVLQTNTQLINTIRGAQTGVTRVRVSEINGALGDEDMPPIEVYNSNVDVDGVVTKILPDNKVLFLPPAGLELGYTAWGLSATALELVNSSETDLSFSNAPGIVGVVEKDGPPYRKFTYVDAVGMPVIDNPRALMIATVF